MHIRICGMHSGARFMDVRVLREGYYWATVKQDTCSYTEKCHECQKFRVVFNAPLEKIHETTIPWRFSKWRVDILDPFPLAKG